jgi:hypothetical protein
MKYAVLDVHVVVVALVVVVVGCGDNDCMAGSKIVGIVTNIAFAVRDLATAIEVDAIAVVFVAPYLHPHDWCVVMRVPKVVAVVLGVEEEFFDNPQCTEFVQPQQQSQRWLLMNYC